MTVERRRWWVVAAGMLASLWLGPLSADAQTRKGAIRDDSVYCQNWPGGPARPDYPGTGPQTPCGPAFQRPQAAPELPEASACPASAAALERPAGPAGDGRARLRLAAAVPERGGIWIAGRQLGAAIAPELESFLGGSALRREIFCAMRDNITRRFAFADLAKLQKTIRVREEAIAFFRKIIADLAAHGEHPEELVCRFSPADFQIAGSKWQGYVNSDGIEIAGQRYAGRSAPGVSAHAAIEAFRNGHSRLECLMGIQLTFLQAVDQALGDAPAFDALHPLDGPGAHAIQGIGVGLLDVTKNLNAFTGAASYTIRIRGVEATSFARHLIVVRYHVLHPAPRKPALDRPDDPLAGVIAAADMVPGDYVYLSNLPEYLDLWRALAPDQRRAVSGAWAGENAVYMGSGKFFGLGFAEESTEEALKQSLAKAYNDVVAASNVAVRLFHGWSATAGDIEWTLLAGPTVEGDPGEAGRFVAP